MPKKTRQSRFSPEVRERAVRLVQDHGSQWAAIRSIAEKIGSSTQMLRSWVQQAERDAGQRPGIDTVYDRTSCIAPIASRYATLG
ncbi:MAG: transposase [bacterium]